MSDENLVGQTLAGKYRVEKVLGKGGMGLVVGARHLGLDEPVAIKVLRPAMMDVQGMVARFLREARAASKIKSEHVVRVTDVDTREDGVPYMVMEHLTGIDFAELRKQKGTFGVAEAVGYVLEACEAIAEAHEIGIVHRDLKPGNLFLHTRRDGRRVVKVLDFGISKLDAPGEQDTTKTGQMMGSPKYMSPEQMLNMRDVDARSDIWSLGAILFEFLCGRPPFQGDTTPRICAQVLNADPPLPHTLRADIPPELELVILRCLDKEPDRRFSDVRALVAALTPYGPPPEVLLASGKHPAPALVTSTPLPATASTPTPSTTPPGTVAGWDTTKYVGPQKKPATGRRNAIIGGAVVLLGGAAIFYATRGGSAPAAPVTPPPVAAAATVPSVSATATAEPAKPGVSPHDLPDVEASASAAPLKAPVPGGSVAKKPKTAPTADPFGGRRN
jgi:serine/threonine-protein kinase